jgi:hypothetical protein
MILLHQRRDALDSLIGQLPFDFGHKRTSESMSAEIRMDNQPIDVASPTIERPDDRANEPSLSLGDKDLRRTVGDGQALIVGSIGNAWRGIRLSP